MHKESAQIMSIRLDKFSWIENKCVPSIQIRKKNIASTSVVPFVTGITFLPAINTILTFDTWSSLPIFWTYMNRISNTMHFFVYSFFHAICLWDSPIVTLIAVFFILLVLLYCNLWIRFMVNRISTFQTCLCLNPQKLWKVTFQDKEGLRLHIELKLLIN